MSVASVPLKTILAYHADATNETTPVGYEVCDGRTLLAGTHDIAGGGSSYTLPDLRNRFLLGADLTKAPDSPGATGTNPTDAPGPRGLGGAHSRTLSLNELPSHTHTGSTDSQGLHSHTGSTTDAGGSHTHTGSISTAGAHAHAGTIIASAGAHAHAGSTAITDGAHTHTVNDAGHIHGGPSGSSGLLAGNAGGFQGWSFTGGPHNFGNTGSSTTGITIASGGGHTHALSILSDGSHAHTITIASDGDHTHSITTNAAGSTHSHTISALSTDGAHTHNLTIGNTGSGAAYDTRPRFYGVVYIMKVRI